MDSEEMEKKRKNGIILFLMDNNHHMFNFQYEISCE